MTTPDVPYVSQKGNVPANDCGPACALMLAAWLGKRTSADTVEAWSRKIDAADDGTTAQQLTGMLRALGLTPVMGSAASWPAIALVDYVMLPLANRSDKSGKTFGHWIVRLSESAYHDPYHFNSAGANLQAPASVMDAAMRMGAQRYAGGALQIVGIVERPAQDTQNNMSNNTAAVKAASWNVRTAPSTKASIVGVLTKGDVVSIAGTVRGENANWYVVQALAGGATIKQSSDEKSSLVYYMRSDGFATSSAPPDTNTSAPKIITSRLLGLHVISHHQYAIDAYNKGARAFVWMEGHTGAEEFAAARPDALVLYRKNLGRFHYNAGDLINAVEGMRSNLPNLLYIGENEDDQTNSNNDLEKRLRRDAEVAKARPGRYVMGEFAMGTPRLEDANVQRLFREIIAPLYNAGQIWIGFHTYTPRNHWVKQDGSAWNGVQDGLPFCVERDGKPCDPIWYSSRWRFLFTHCGFDPRVRHVLSGETGADWMGVGGFPAQQTSNAEFEAWCRGYLALQRFPLTLASGQFAGTYESPLVAACLFQRSDFPDWGGYRINDNYLSVLQALYAEAQPRSLMRQIILDEWTPRTPAPDYATPPSKWDGVKLQ